MKIFSGYKKKGKKRYGLADKGNGFELFLASGKKIYLRERYPDSLEIMSVDGPITITANASNVFYVEVKDRRVASYAEEIKKHASPL